MRLSEEKKRLTILKRLIDDHDQRLVRQHGVGCFVDTAFLAKPPIFSALRAGQWLIAQWMVRPIPDPTRSADGPVTTHYTITAKGREYFMRNRGKL